MDNITEALKEASKRRTICEVHREIYEIACNLGLNDVRQLVREAFEMGKKMDAKLREYKKDWDAGFYGPNEDHREDRERRKLI